MLLLGRWMFHGDLAAYALVAIFFRKVELSTDQRAAVQLLDCIQTATDIATSCWAADEAGFSVFHFRPRSSSVWTCGTRSTGPLDGHFYISMFVEVLYFQPSLWWQWTYNRISAAIFLVAMNLHSNTFQPPLWWWHCRICQVAIWALHYPHQSRRTPFYLARSSEFSMSSDFLCFLRLTFQTSTGDITRADLF